MRFKGLSVVAVVGLFMFAVGHPATAQDTGTKIEQSSDPASKLGKLVARKGVLIQQERKQMGIVGGMGFSQLTITAVSAFDPTTPDVKTKGFLLVFYDKRDKSDYYYNAYIDLDEASNLMKSLRYMKDVGQGWKGKDVGAKFVQFTGTDDYQISLENYVVPETGERKQRYVAFAGTVYQPRVTFRGADVVEKAAKMLEDGAVWLSQQ